MKKIVSLFVLLASASAFAQELTEAQKAALAAAQTLNSTEAEAPAAPKPNYWKNSIDFDLGFNQVALINWAAGGYASISLAAGIDGKANYEKGRAVWNNRMQLNYGFLWSADKVNLLQSANDRIYLESKYDYRMSDKSKWSYSAGLDFRTQFADTRDNYRHENKDDLKSKWVGDLKSTFLSPAYLNLALGLDWKPTQWFDMSIAPLTGGVVIVTNENLRGSYGMELLNAGVVGADPKYKGTKWQLGTQVKMNLKASVNDWFNYETQFVFFGNYLGKELDKANKTHDWFRLNWDNKISFNVAKYFKIALQTWLIYDPSIIYNKKDESGKVVDFKARPVQFKEALTINFTYTIASKK